MRAFWLNGFMIGIGGPNPFPMIPVNLLYK